MYEDRWSRPAARKRAQLDPTDRARIDEAIDELRRDPFRASNARPLTGPLRGIWRKRVGSWRIFFVPDPNNLVLENRALNRRKDAYR